MNRSHITAILENCERHSKRLSWAKNQLDMIAPITETTLLAFNDNTVAIVDQFIFRFAKLQDAMGTQLFPAILELTAEPGQLSTFIDKLNRLEKIGAIEATEDWLKLREIRNQIAHEYPDDAALQASLLNLALKQTTKMIQILEHQKAFIQPYLPIN